MKRHTILAFLFFTVWGTPWLHADEKELKISVGWKYTNLPKEIMKIYELRSGAQVKLWETRAVASFAETPAAAEIQDGLDIPTGSVKTFVLVMHNPTKKPLYFFAAPHQVVPVQASLGFKFKCLCVNHAFRVNAGGYWYRIVRLELSEKYRGDKGFTILHDLIGIDAKQMQDFALPSGKHSHDE